MDVKSLNPLLSEAVFSITEVPLALAPEDVLILF